jgi:hypothetical protein
MIVSAFGITYSLPATSALPQFSITIGMVGALTPFHPARRRTAYSPFLGHGHTPFNTPRGEAKSLLTCPIP